MIGQNIGQYRIIRIIGEGGMGTVYEAEQQQPKRAVALKVIRSGTYVDEHLIRMFEREIQSLALLKHAYIASIYESGRTEDGQHYFAMELVRGKPLDQWIADNTGDSSSPVIIKLRLALFRKICDAVSYAHQRGVIHRDLKPANIMVLDESELDPDSESGSSRVPDVKILDFGLARITEKDIAAATMVTQVGELLGTLPYMSPEQVRGIPDDIDMRSDVYALGVILYEILAGQLPYDVRDAALHKAVQVILETPPSPFNKVWTGSRKPDRDLENITLKALEKDPTRRYQSASALSEDIERYLTDQPIMARPPSAIYQLQKMVRRHKLAFSFTVILLTLLVGFAVVTITQTGLIIAERNRAVRLEEEASQGRDEAILAREQAETAEEETRRQKNEAETARAQAESAEHDALNQRDIADEALAQARVAEERANEERDAAQQAGDEAIIARGDAQRALQIARENFEDAQIAREEAEEVIDWFTTTLSTVEPGQRGEDLRVVDVLDRSAIKIDSELVDQPLVQAGVHHTIGRTYWQLGFPQKAEPHLQRALDLRIRLRGEENLISLQYMNDLAVVSTELGQMDRVGPLLGRVTNLSKQLLGEEDRRTLTATNNLALHLLRTGYLNEAEAIQVDVLNTSLRLFQMDDDFTLMAMHNLALIYSQMGNLTSANSLLVRVREKRRELLGDDAIMTLTTMCHLAEIRRAMEENEEAEQMLNEALEGFRRAGIPEHPIALKSMGSLASLYQEQDRIEDAQSLYERALNGYRSADTRGTVDAVNCMESLKNLYREAGDLENYESMLLEILDAGDGTVEDDPNYWKTMTELAAYYYALDGHYDEAASYYASALEGWRRIRGSFHADTIDVMKYLAKALRMLDNLEDAENLQREILSILETRYPDAPEARGDILVDLGNTLIRTRKFEEAEPLIRESLEIRRQTLAPDDWHIFNIMSILGECLLGMNDYGEAGALLERAWNGLSSSRQQIPNVNKAEALRRLIQLNEKLGREEIADDFYRQWLLYSRTRPIPPSGRTYNHTVFPTN